MKVMWFCVRHPLRALDVWKQLRVYNKQTGQHVSFHSIDVIL